MLGIAGGVVAQSTASVEKRADCAEAQGAGPVRRTGVVVGQQVGHRNLHNAAVLFDGHAVYGRKRVVVGDGRVVFGQAGGVGHRGESGYAAVVSGRPGSQ